MRYVVYGAGAVGGVIGGHLHLAGLPVTLVARGAHLEAIRRRAGWCSTPATAATASTRPPPTPRPTSPGPTTPWWSWR